MVSRTPGSENGAEKDGFVAEAMNSVAQTTYVKNTQKHHKVISSCLNFAKIEPVGEGLIGREKSCSFRYSPGFWTLGAP